MKTKKYKIEQITINHDKKRKPLSAKQRADMQGKYRYYGAQSVIDYVNDYLFDGEYLLIAEDGENLKSGKQNIAQIVEGQFWLNNHAHIVQTNELCNIRFLEYWLNSADISGYITGSAQPKLSQANLNAIEIFLPSRDIQDKIVNILYSFDQKIEINNQINRNLSEQQNVLYNLYFAKCDGKVKKVKDVISFSQGVQVPVEEQLLKKKDGYEQFIRIVDVAQNNTDIRYVKDTQRGRITEYDVFMVRYGSQTAGMISRGKRGIIANNLFTIKSEVLSEEYLYCYFGSETVRNYLKGNSSSSTMPAINFGTLNAMDILIPERRKMEEFTVVSRRLFEQKLLVEREIKKLVELRDTLLPKLMSGELDVSDLDI